MRVLLAISGIVSVYILKLITSKRRQNPRRLPYPPGPKGYPIIGNLLELPLHKPWLVYQELSRRYGTMVFFHGYDRKGLTVILRGYHVPRSHGPANLDCEHPFACVGITR